MTEAPHLAELRFRIYQLSHSSPCPLVIRPCVLPDGSCNEILFVVNHITYQNQGSGYWVVKVKVKGYDGLDTLVGIWSTWS